MANNRVLRIRQNADYSRRRYYSRTATRKLSRNGVPGNDDQGSGQIVGYSEVILRSLTTISNGKSASVYR